MFIVKVSVITGVLSVADHGPGHHVAGELDMWRRPGVRFGRGRHGIGERVAGQVGVVGLARRVVARPHVVLPGQRLDGTRCGWLTGKCDRGFNGQGREGVLSSVLTVIVAKIVTQGTI